MEFITSIVLLTIALWLVNFLGKILVGELFRMIGRGRGNSSGGSSKTRGQSAPDKKAVSKLKSAQTHLEENNFPLALKDLKNSFILDYKSVSKCPPESYEHNQHCLSLLLKLADAQNLRIDNLPIVEQLVGELEEIDQELIGAEVSFKSLKKKRKEAKKEIPNWSKEEFENNLNTLRGNRKDISNTLNQQLKELYKSLEKPSKSSSSGTENVTYH